MKPRFFFLFLCLAVGSFAGCASCGDNNDNGATNGGTDPDMGSDVGDMTPDPDGSVPDGGDMGTPIDENIITCPNNFAPPAEGLCEASAGNDYVLFQVGEVLAASSIYENGTVLVDGTSGEIACVGCDCADEANASGATTVTCAEGVLSPALINPHDHITFSLSWPQPHGEERFDHRHDWRRGLRDHNEVNTSPGSDDSREGVLYGELRMLLGGATSIAGSSTRTDASGFLRNLDNPDGLEGLTGIDVDYRTFPLGDGSNATLRSNGCDYPNIDSESRAASAGIYLPHIAEGIDAEAHNEFRCLSANDGGGVDLIAENTSIIHGIGLTVTDIAEVAANGAKLVWSPRSNIDLYGNTARVTTFKNFGVTIALGTDWSASGSMNVLRELKCADFLNTNYYDRAFTDRELWQMSTYNSAVAMGADNQIGVIAERFVADLTLFDGRASNRYRAVIDADVEDVNLVMRGGTPIYGDANVIEALVPAGEVDQCEPLDICGNNRRVCAERDTGLTVDAIRSAVSQGAYPLYFCGEPEDEPSCVPFRPMEYTGMTGGTDTDGDGIEDAVDLCPSVFTPVRPMDDGMQNDFDGDGDGDDCDTCPLSDDDTCPGLDPDDRDGDGVPNLMDNCPSVPNPGQENSDGDQFGDACDPCPDFDNSESLACPANIYEIRSGTWKVGDQVALQEVVVTATSDVAFFVQVPEDASYYAGVESSGLYIYAGSGGTVPDVGDVVSLEGRLGDFGDTLQLSDLSNLVVAESGHDLPAFTEVSPAEVATGGARADALEATLVRVRDVSVTDENPDAPDDFGEFQVTGDLRVDDLLYLVEPEPAVGDQFAILQGPLTFSFGNNKLLPRDPTDVITGPASLDGLEPDTAFIKAGTTAIPTPTLEVVLSGPSLGDAIIDLTYTGNVSGPAEVTVLDGMDRATISLTAAAAGTGTVTAAYDGDMDTTTVTVYDDASVRAVANLTPSTTLSVNGTLAMTATLTVPAPSGGQAVTLTYSPGTSLSGPATVSIPEDALSATFDVTAGAVAATETVTAAIGGSSQTATVEVIVGSLNCLIISEYIEGSGSNNKAIELYNCSPGVLDLSNFAVCLVSNQNTSCNATASLGSVQLAAGEVYTVCKTTGGSAGDPVDGIKNNCDLEASSIANFNGNDRLIVFEDTNSNDQLDAGDEVVDAFGETAIDPGAIWANVTYRRCDFTQYDGMSTFDVDALFTSHPENDASDFGTPPTEGCP